MKDIYRNILVSQHLNPAAVSTAQTSSTIDLQGYDSANVVFAVGLSAATLSGSVYWTLKLTHSDESAANFTDVTEADLSNSAATVVIDSSSEDETVYGFGYVGSKRYLRAVATPTGSHGGTTPIGVIALRGTPAYAPVN